MTTPPSSTRNWRNAGWVGRPQKSAHPVPSGVGAEAFRQYRADMHDVVRYTLRTGDLRLVNLLMPTLGQYSPEAWEALSPASRFAGCCIYACVVPELADLAEQAAEWLRLHHLRVPTPA